MPFPRAVQRVSCEPEREPKPAGSQVPRAARPGPARPPLRWLPARRRAGLRTADDMRARGAGRLHSMLSPCLASRSEPAGAATGGTQRSLCEAVPPGSHAVMPRKKALIRRRESAESGAGPLPVEPRRYRVHVCEERCGDARHVWRARAELGLAGARAEAGVEAAQGGRRQRARAARARHAGRRPGRRGRAPRRGARVAAVYHPHALRVAPAGAAPAPARPHARGARPLQARRS